MSVLSHISKTCSEWDLLHEIFCRPCHLWQHVIYFQFPVCCQLVKFSHDVEYACRPTAYYLVRRVMEFGCECDQSRPDDALICLTLQHYPVVYFSRIHRRSFRGGGLAPSPKPLIVDNIFSKTESSHDTYYIGLPWYIIISNFITHIIRQVCQKTESTEMCLVCWLQSYSPRAYCQNIQSNYFAKSCSEQKNTWSRFDLP